MSDIPAMVRCIKETLVNSHYYDQFFYNIDKLIYIGYD